MNPLQLALRSLPSRFSEKIYYRFLCGKTKKNDTVETPLRRPRSEVRVSVVRGDVIGDAIYWTGIYESQTTKAMEKIASEEGGILIDVGANIGYYSLIWCQAKASNRSIAIEASPPNIELLKANLSHNQFVDQCTLETRAVSSHAGETNFDLGPRSQTGWGGISDGIGSGSRVIKVPTERLDQMIPEDLPIRLLKIDVEGAEALVFEGAESILRRRQVAEIWFEDNVERREALGISLNRLTEALLRNNYQIKSASNHHNLAMDFVAYAPAPSAST